MFLKHSFNSEESFTISLVKSLAYFGNEPKVSIALFKWDISLVSSYRTILDSIFVNNSKKSTWIISTLESSSSTASWFGLSILLL